MNDLNYYVSITQSIQANKRTYTDRYGEKKSFPLSYHEDQVFEWLGRDVSFYKYK